MFGFPLLPWFQTRFSYMSIPTSISFANTGMIPWISHRHDSSNRSYSHAHSLHIMLPIHILWSFLKVPNYTYHRIKVRKALPEASLLGEPRVNLTALYYRNLRLVSKDEDAQGQQYLTPLIVGSPWKVFKTNASLGNHASPVSSFPAVNIARQRSTTNIATKTLGKK